MSYILDALKKADAERERRGVPGLNAQVADPGDAQNAGGGSRIATAVGALALLATGAVAAWWFLRADTPPASEGVVAAAPPPPPAPITATAAPPPSPLPQVVVPPTPAPVIVPPAPPKPAPVPVAAASAPEAPLPSYANLPPDVKSRLPALVVGGSVYSPNAASRMIIVNGQVLREGDQPADGLTVERIGLKSTQMSYRGTRFELKH